MLLGGEKSRPCLPGKKNVAELSLIFYRSPDLARGNHIRFDFKSVKKGLVIWANESGGPFDRRCRISGQNFGVYGGTLPLPSKLTRQQLCTAQNDLRACIVHSLAYNT